MAWAILTYGRHVLQLYVERGAARVPARKKKKKTSVPAVRVPRNLYMLSGTALGHI